jgi:hypothetical protein
VNSDFRALTSALSRSATLIVAIAVALVAYFWLIQPRVTAYVLARNDVRTKQVRLQTGQEALARAARIQPVTDAAFMADFNRRMSADDKVSEIIASIAKALATDDSGTHVRGLLIEAGEHQRIEVQSAVADERSDFQPRVAQNPEAGRRGVADGDPRARQFPVPLLCTPVAVSFESDFESVGTFLWGLRDAPTVVEVNSLAIERGLPLMRVRAQLLIYQRLGAGDQGDAGESPRSSAANLAPGELASNLALR